MRQVTDMSCAGLLTSFGCPEGDEVVGVVDSAETLHLDFHLIGTVRLEDFQNAIGFVAVGFQNLPNAFTDHPARESHPPPVRTVFSNKE